LILCGLVGLCGFSTVSKYHVLFLV
jgi:hypothetical protein